ncbi:hypothetical protein D1872_296620 [compost metagenome]
MLSWCYFVVGSFNLEAHLFQCQNDLATAILAQIRWSQIEVSTLVIQFFCRIALLICLEQEELRLRSNIHGRVAHFFGFLQHFLQDPTWISSERLAIWHINITD